MTEFSESIKHVACSPSTRVLISGGAGAATTVLTLPTAVGALAAGAGVGTAVSGVHQAACEGKVELSQLLYGAFAGAGGSWLRVLGRAFAVASSVTGGAGAGEIEKLLENLTPQSLAQNASRLFPAVVKPFERISLVGE